MASVRTAVLRHALDLAHRADAHMSTADITHVPPAVIAQLRGTARQAGEPEAALRWAWRSQRACWRDTRRTTDALASIYLLAALHAGERPTA